MVVGKFLKEVEKIKEEHRKKKDSHDNQHSEVHDEGNWLISYADMMTLLCGFFIMLFSMAKLDEPKYDSLKKHISEEFGGKYVAPDSVQLAKVMTQILDELGLEKDLMIHSDPLGVSVVFQSLLFFDTLSAEVKAEGKNILYRLIEAIAARQKLLQKEYKIVVEGHTDNRPIMGGTFPSNWELSGARAARVVRMFLERGFKPSYLTAIGYGDTRPQVVSRTLLGQVDLEALAKNRRVVLRVLEPGVDSVPLPEAVPEAVAKPVEAASSAH